MAGGTLGYAIYNYAYYLFGTALNPFFPLYLAAVITAALALILALSGIAPSKIARRFNAGTPAWFIGGYFVIVGISLVGIWLAVWAAYVFNGRPTRVDTEAFKLIARDPVVAQERVGLRLVRNCRGSRLALSAGAGDQLNHRRSTWSC